MFNNKYGAEIQDYRVLIVERENRVTEFFGTVLSVLGVKHIYFADDGRVALRQIQKGLLTQRKCPFDLLIVNNGMPGMSGMELIGCLRQERELRGMSMIVTTRESPEEILQECNRLEVCALLRQPFDLENMYLSSSQARV
jgi:CheY-like chemotaxis protein